MLQCIAKATPLTSAQLFSSDDLTNGVLKEIPVNDGLILDDSTIRMPDWYIGDPDMCEQTYMIVMVDPFQGLADKNREDNIVMFPIERDCSSFAPSMDGMWCDAMPEYGVLGEIWTNLS